MNFQHDINSSATTAVSDCMIILTILVTIKINQFPHTSRHLLLPSDMNYKEFHDVPSTTPKNGWESRQGVEKADDRGLPAMMMGTPMWTTRAPFTLCPEK